MADGRNRPNRPIRPRQGAPAGRRKRRVVIDTGAARPRQDGRQRRDQQEQKPREKTPVAPQTGPVTVESGVTVKDLSQALGVPVPKLITILMGLGAPKTVTQSLADEEVELIATEVGREVNIKHAAEEELEPEVYEDDEADLTARPPVVTIMGHVDHGKTMLVHRGTLRVGDAIVAGDAWGKVRALYNFRGEKVKEATPGDPIEILGFDHPPPAGEQGRVVEHERQARHLANLRGERLRREQLAQQAKAGPSLETLFTQMQAGGVQDLNLVVKGDVDGSVEAAVSELQKIQHPEVRVNVIHTGVGAISENDV